MNCPYCNSHFKNFIVNAKTLPTLAPVLCEKCTKISILDNGQIRAASNDELDAIKQSPAFRDMLKPVQDGLRQRN